MHFLVVAVRAGVFQPKSGGRRDRMVLEAARPSRRGGPLCLGRCRSTTVRTVSEGNTAEHYALFFDRRSQTTTLRTGMGRSVWHRWRGFLRYKAGVPHEGCGNDRSNERTSLTACLLCGIAPRTFCVRFIRTRLVLGRNRPFAGTWPSGSIPQILCSPPSPSAMSWIYKHPTEALAVFAGAAFVMCLGALMHTATRGYPLPKAAYLACTIIYIVAASVYLFFWYHSRLKAAAAHPDQIRFLHRRRPWTPKPTTSPELLRTMMLRPRPMADAQASPTAPSPVPAGSPYMPRPVEQIAAHPPAARFSTPAPPASRVPPAGPRMPPDAIARKPLGSAGIPGQRTTSGPCASRRCSGAGAAPGDGGDAPPHLVAARIRGTNQVGPSRRS